MPDASSNQPGGNVYEMYPGELQIRQLLDSLPAAAYTCNPAGLITYYNQAALKMWGRAPALYDTVDRFCGSFKLYSPDGEPISHDECWMALALRHKRQYSGEEVVIERPDGQRMTGLANANVICDDQGHMVGAVNVLIDITEQRRAAEAQVYLASIVETADDAIISKSIDGRILTWNEGAERLFGYSAAEAIGAPITLVIPTELLSEEQSILARLRAGERIEHFETVRVSKTGKRIPISLTISPVRNNAGRVVGASKIARDISQRRETEEAVRSLHHQLISQVDDLRRLGEMSMRLSTTLELPPILEETLGTVAGIFGTDMGLLSLCDENQQGLTVGASLGFDAEALAIMAQVPAGDGACGHCLDSRRRVIVEDTETDPIFEKYRELAHQAGFRGVHSTPLITRTGKMVGVLALHFRHVHRPSDREQHLMDLCARQAVDFIENARLYDQLRTADRRKEVFLATLAHELRNPLAPISNSLHLLSLANDLNPSQQTIVEIMNRQMGYLVRLVDDLLEVSRITSGKIDLRKESVALAGVIRNAVETSQPTIDGAGHQLALVMPSEPLVLEADPVRLAQVLANLLNNSAKYTPEGGQIWLTVSRENDEVVISVRDNGVGIPAEILPRVFDMFTQADHTISRSHGGLGIGLTLARTLVQLHGGSIEARSEGTNQGSEFVVRLPLLKTSGLALLPGTASPTAPKVIPRRRVLVVDDSRASAFVLGRLLETMGHDVHVCSQAEEALRYAIAEQPDVVISDIGMPQMDGYELAKKIRQHEELDRTLLVALTGYAQESDRDLAIEAGFDKHLVKPVGVGALEDLLERSPLKDRQASRRQG